MTRRVCGARARSTGNPCQLSPRNNGRCYLHGGKSTGPKTQEGRQRQIEASTKHGYYSREAIQERKRMRQLIQDAKDLISQVH